MSRLFFYPYIGRSKSIEKLGRKLRDGGTDIKVIRLQNSTFVNGPGKLVINWGSTAIPLSKIQQDGAVLNRRSAVQTCANKLRFFTALSGTDTATPEWTSDANVARRWVDEGTVVVARHTLNGHSGQGIKFSDEEANFFEEIAPLYTKYVPKKEEFRVHIVRGNVIDVQQKKMRTEDDNGVAVNREDINFRVRSHKNGFIFARQDIRVPEEVTRQALSAFGAIENLDFGAVDVIYNARQNRAYVLEINTAPGLEGSTLEAYANAFSAL